MLLTHTMLIASGAIPGYAFNPADKGSSVTLSGSNLIEAVGGGGTTQGVRGTVSKSSGKWYLEFVAVAASAAASVGIADATWSNTSQHVGGNGLAAGYRNDGALIVAGSTLATVSTWIAGDIIGVAFDLTALKVWFAKNSTWQNSGNPAAGTGSLAISSASFFAAAAGFTGTSVRIAAPQTFAPPAGFATL